MLKSFDFSPFWIFKLSTSHLEFYFSKYIVHAYVALELRVVVIAGWCRFDTSNLWRIIQQNKWKNKAEWGILSNRSEVGLDIKSLQVIKLVSVKTTLFHFISEKSAYFPKITFYAWPQSYNWFLLALVVKMCSTCTFNPRAVHIASFIW